ncbi:helix-turn-helix domain-containing protein [Streptomyces sp. H27-D2]|uniref:helix-turn-helix domain-containing protein n=1 Tax=Streptomyces sp. H27-D2 TaxID=3046304 RepID=UPI002DBD3C27|nr:helix-turn-helix transcriptional regulator [Streptomyces sp. H27-D2]MEC4016988.1 helix-turn-helix transcriptional regulator [Streptomyces sp. H27-D2]
MATETEGFAALLRELKSRSGRSYGVLAGKLHVSTSTLHRYCNGDAVPTEYAPVERLGRLCGASPEELVGLHRQWILADAARRRKPVGAAAEPAPEPVPEPVPEPAGVVDEPVPEPVGASDEPVPEPVGASDEPVPEPVAVVVPEAGRRTWTRARLALATAAVVAVAVPAALAVGHAGTPSGGEKTVAGETAAPAHAPQAASGSASGGPRSKGTGKSKGAATSGASGSAASASSASSADGGGKGKGEKEGDGKSSAGTPGSGGSGGGAGAAPLGVDLQPNSWQDRCSQFYLLDQAPSAVPPPPAEQDTRAWARALHGVPGGAMQMELAVQGRTDQAVVLRALYIRVVGSTAPLKGAAYSMGGGCGGGLTPASFDVDLDAGRPLARAVAGEQEGRRIPPTTFPYKVSATDPEVLNVYAHTDGHTVSWYLELEWSTGDRHGTVRVDDHGKPFRTSGMNGVSGTKGHALYDYRPDESAWKLRDTTGYELTP